MRRRVALTLAALLVCGVPAWRSALAATTLRIVRPFDLAALPLIVMEREHLIERVAEAMGLGEVQVTWRADDPAGPLAALAAGRADLAVADLPAFLIAADATAGPAGDIRALAAVLQRPYVLVTRNRAIHTILDFRDGDHIAVPALRVSGPALMLEMAAAQQWGPEQYARLDRLVVARADAAAMADLLSGGGGIDAHFSHSPYVDAELGDPAIHRVMDSFDIAGPHSTTLLATTTAFAAANGELMKAVLSALETANDKIRKNPGATAEIYSAAVPAHGVSPEELSDMIGDPDVAYSAAPAGVLRLHAFMQRIGRLKRAVQRWQELFVPAARDMKGS